MNPSKIHPLLQEHLATRVMGVAGPPTVPVIVHYRARTSMAAQVGGISRPTRLFTLLPAAAHTAVPDAVRALSDYDHVQMIWLDERVHVPPDQGRHPRGVRAQLNRSAPLIRADQVWNLGVNGEGVKVGVVDTGIDQSHPDFGKRVVLFKDFTGQGETDSHGHGTHVAGIIGGSGLAGQGRYIGVAPACLLLAFRVLDANGSGMTTDVMAGVEEAVRQGCQVINLSLGSDGSSDGQDALSVICNAAAAKGVVVCVAAGNEGPGPCTIGSPGAARDALTVGASDDADQIAGFSSRGPTADGRVKPDLVFPGVDIISCRATNTYMGERVGTFYTRVSGTSMATPHAAGVAALLLQANPKLTPMDVKGIMQFTAKNLGCDENTQGKGRGDAWLAYEAALPTNPNPPPTPPPEPPPLPGGCGQAVQKARRAFSFGR